MHDSIRRCWPWLTAARSGINLRAPVVEYLYFHLSG